MFKIITFTDVHLADKNPASRKDNYLESLLNKLEQIKDICEQRKVDIAVCAGDLFHLKTPLKNSHFLVSTVISLFKKFPCPVLSIYGNHDIRQDNISTLTKQPFYTLVKSGAISFLEEEFYADRAIRVIGMDYASNPEYVDFNRENKGEKIQICVAHVNASSKFSDLFGERVYTYQELAKTTPDIFVFGHYHPDQGIEVHNNKHFINVGSLSRGSLKKDELSRIPNVGYIEIDDSFNINCQKIPLNVLSSDVIFDLVQKEKEDKEQEEIQSFINEMKNKLVVKENEDLVGKIKSLGFEKNIIDRTLEYFERAEK